MLSLSAKKEQNDGIKDKGGFVNEHVQKCPIVSLIT